MKERKLNILFLSGWYPSRVHPTLGNFVQKHAECVALNSNVSALNVIADSSCNENYEITEQMINNVYTINVYYKKVKTNIPFLSKYQKFVKNKKAYKLGIEAVLKRSGNIDIVHHNILYPSGLMALKLKKEKGIPYLITEHSTRYLSSKKISLSASEILLSKKIASNANFICPVSEDLKNAMIAKGLTGTYKVIYNVVDTTLFHPLQSKASAEKIKFLHISTLDDPHKNISGMLHSVYQLSQQRSDFECYFIGDGDVQPHIEKAKSLGIYNRSAFFGGTKTKEEIAELMRNSDCFILFSNYENLPVVIIEAFASGLPVISSNVGGIAEHLNAERGKLVPPKDNSRLVHAMNEMIIELGQKKYDRNRIAQYAEEHFSYEKISRQFHDLYKIIKSGNV